MLSGVATEKSRQVLAGFFFVWLPAGLSVKKHGGRPTAYMPPAFLLAMYEKDGLPAEKVLKNIIRARFLRPGVRPYQTQNIYAPFAGRGAVRKEDAIAKGKSNQRKKNRKG